MFCSAILHLFLKSSLFLNLVLGPIIFLVSFNRFTDTEIDEMLHGAPVDSKGLFDYVKFTKIIKHGKDDD